MGRENSQKHGTGLPGLLRFEGHPTMAGRGPLAQLEKILRFP
jgi:hypothetical protein